MRIQSRPTTNLPIALCILLACALASTAQATAPKAGVYTGPTQLMSRGRACAWVIIGDGSKPTAIGITFSRSALTGLPNSDAEYVLPLPPEAASTPFKSIVINWNHMGHIPVGIYDVPHFDFHFYTIPEQEREQIAVTGEGLQKARKVPESRYVPPDYIFAPGGEWPRMGAHWVDKTTPELHGKPFTQTFVYGFYDAKLVFLEPMADKTYLETMPNLRADIKQPQAYAVKGYYPTTYVIKYNRKEQTYSIYLTGMKLRQAGW